MNPQIKVESNVIIWDGLDRAVSITVTKDGCKVALALEVKASCVQTELLDPRSIDIPWAQIEDPKFISEKFRLETVCVFAHVVEQLDKINTSRSTYLSLL